MTSQLESILYIASKPLSRLELKKALGVDNETLETAIIDLKERFNSPNSGIHIIDTGADIQMVTNPENVEIVAKFTTQELMGELTRAQLETLTVVAYQGPITRPEIEAIRGVNCAIILRNLSLRGLVEEEESIDALMAVYRVSATALRQLGLHSPEDLSNYSELHNHAHIVASVEPNNSSVTIHD
ncbi:MAG: SMC-Scp complex subunit ScpB [Candidatus Magasanikbacteria bacterium RIFCSPHIGHO2_01_FULL_41_23]|uniref:SMC-Scp complex subunit ScpB n=1 Tax=Candidatus Magasanikbacteria bacterium RIFCSPLOWO2_01_FULL_40_15 TaxID=1798686 RepID=A0A1F6N3V4_9BACT|nr:MAG: SMC-Scp complex subunit ScpB [Candidatus Magasanikbacteria bacterium RIFCSPHIGHO2_01_FULL_41_23]OGH67139.1 MAG: SMC-Scp complex subunit ScpB [Candidatus Magasanikbacteria bacterium RIFCSPHIGHO2_02_FULL_41_35]OGH76727.1 MAG: SMC-Scp complex subunit ScpB [Candidatus Magasanikbacteria bacterium RIFCSPHIGHO2_12_FULL_41_16]OGH78675.1 MAG: SMC-Scp complex subunit ScpB [Candidatus Magasanikbacteria bacterium RIFCSPLOWO2_01_FULL_40_15]